MNSLKYALAPLASLKLTVTLLAMSMFLVFAGTLAQVEHGIWTVVDRYFRSLVVWIDLQLFVPPSFAEVPGRFPFPGGFLLAGLLIVNLIAGHVATFKMTRKRIGIVVLHAGLILMLLSEFITGIYAVEGNMTIDEGKSANYVEDIRTCELVVIDPSHQELDTVIAVPQYLLGKAASARTEEGRKITHPQLPFDIDVLQFMPNSQLFLAKDAPEGIRPMATRDVGAGIIARAIPQITGVEEQKVDAPTAIISLSHQGQPMGIWLVSLYIDQPQRVQVGDKTYELFLRFKRDYKPYTLHLIDFRHDKFVGTDKPRNFSSLVRLVDPTHNEDREVLIYMNAPLRYRGETFYQSAFKPGDTGTILQVVRNPGWLLPYISCVMVTLGMMIHFGMRMIDGASRTSGAAAANNAPLTASAGGAA